MAAEQLCPAIFITGTDTGVGKTLVTAALARHLSDLGMDVGVMKPVETGVSDLANLGLDGSLLRWAAHSQENVDEISPYRFSAALSPYQAASLEKRTIDADLIVNRCQELRQKKDIVLIEGAGGLMVPLHGGYIMADMVRDLDVPLLVIARPGLGTLNHTLLTTFAARVMDLKLCGMIINNMPENPSTAEQGAPHLLSSLASADLLGVLPEATGSDQDKVLTLVEAIRNLATYQWMITALGVSL